jgi:hypothetical protein
MQASGEPAMLRDVQLAPGLGYEDGRLVAWMPSLIKGRGVDLLRIPRANFLAEPLTGRSGEDCSSILTPTHVALALRLLGEKEVLPGAQQLLAHHLHAPLHRWNESELAELQSEQLSEAARAERAWLAKQHASALGCAARPLETFLAAVDAVRIHSLPCSGSLAFAPAASLLPRTVPRGATASLDTGSGDLVIKSDGGDDLSVSAGWLTNDELMLSAGWALLDSGTESVALPDDILWAAADEASVTTPPVCELSPQEWEGPVTLASRESREQVLEALRRFRYLEKDCELAVLAGGLCSDSLGNFMQVLCLSQDELALFGEQGCAVNIGETVPISRQHETRVGLALAAACRNFLAGMPTTLQQDEALLTGLPALPSDMQGVAEGGGGYDLEDKNGRLRQSLHSRMAKKRAVDACREKCEIFVALPTATATLRRPWKANIRTSG